MRLAFQAREEAMLSGDFPSVVELMSRYIIEQIGNDDCPLPDFNIYSPENMGDENGVRVYAYAPARSLGSRARSAETTSW